ncbi:ROK family protein [Latilactobacillus fuchuensis]|uniref:Sugar kinase, ROK family n=2 Tax=Latilactobacillus fuchuensis TaxID=164393 RepID=A0A2N9DTC1_9LACO|nr:ROK family protein [Latilactobacillus fuchuensis]KRL60846.1 hypothetical protein FC69_GL001282 [Latilactobacillus fuchuensis DSM 14340 = JCM 11249]MCP8857265.1 ROK family protein [Latilactobacillus fuchuensis]SPC36823.1 putative sugar kinase, ROK family [Latilactobacillus fuchuensis]
MQTGPYYIAYDVGGTSIKYGLIDLNKQLTFLGKLDTFHNAHQAILNQIIQKTSALCETHQIIGIGISTAGIVDRQAGKISYAGPTIPNYQGTELKQILTNQFNLPVYVENDVNAALLGEKLIGAAQDLDNVYCVALGTGIGGAYLLNGQLQDGGFSHANSIGYLLYDPQTKTNYEQRASTLTLEKQLHEQLGFSVPDAFKESQNGNSAVLTIIQQWADSVAQGLAQIILTVDPAVLIIGGGVSQQGNYLIQLLNNATQSYLPPNFYQTKLIVAQNFNDAALFGAVYRFFN